MRQLIHTHIHIHTKLKSAHINTKAHAASHLERGELCHQPNNTNEGLIYNKSLAAATCHTCRWTGAGKYTRACMSCVNACVTACERVSIYHSVWVHTSVSECACAYAYSRTRTCVRRRCDCALVCIGVWASIVRSCALACGYLLCGAACSGRSTGRTAGAEAIEEVATNEVTQKGQVHASAAA